MKAYPPLSLRCLIAAGLTLLLTVLAALTTACASPGGLPPVSATEAEALFTDLSGVWLLDESSSPRILPVLGLTGRREPVRGVSWQPKTLDLRVDRDRLLYRSSHEGTVQVRMNGRSTYWFYGGGGLRVRTRIFWDEGRLGLEHSEIAKVYVRSLRLSRGRGWGLYRRTRVETGMDRGG